ncbi:CPD photolyase [Agaricus bisporus var. bisporus H97]|uniref:CPD photolyase n=1 Tax=Agaricus bisporus var. bisporus (strain H97 / ATCC MYA-4626 / FGSC 10389) TaxID=936046 RepID=UPI00029F5B0C|nr:CPD photolyase [Agaricus bisporus var. bisporus H97]EKV48376.1 CPD photolyase [Agaricus bisporus var. bisporus H97]
MEAAAVVDANPPYFELKQLIEHGMPDPDKGKVVFYWMRFADLRITDNRALHKASEQAQKDGIPLAVLFVLSPEDYFAHDRSSRRIDFVLRNLKLLQEAFSKLHIPLYVITHKPRRTLAERVVESIKEYGCRHLYANLEHEVDELRRDIRMWQLGERHGIQVNLFHDKCIVEPGVVLTKQARGYTIFTPYWRNWVDTLNANLGKYTEKCPVPLPNNESIRRDKKLSFLFQTSVPGSINGFELSDNDAANMKEFWPAGEATAIQVLDRFLKTKSRSSQLGAVDPLSPGAQDGANHNRIHKYHQSRDQMDRDTTSRLSVYLSAGVISVRECVRQTMQLTGSKKVDGNRSAGVGRWIQELAWRDFYTGILVHYPRVSMGRPYLEKYSRVVWENHQAPQDTTGVHEHHDSENFKKWKEGMTGVAIVDAAMRCLNKMGWVHNRARMIVAMYLTKDLMIDWRLGERYFMQTLIDGDLASNNGGWQWSASTGVDPCPYFRIFNPHSQSLNADPTGEFIRYWVPELQKLHGPEIHDPSASTADKLGYPRKVIEHSAARDRALRRFKNPGEA